MEFSFKTRCRSQFPSIPSWLNSLSNPSPSDGFEETAGDESLIAELQELYDETLAIWEESESDPSFHGYVCADYPAVYAELKKLQGRISTVVEWGSGLGVVTIMASKLGFEAYGIESEMELVEHSELLAEKYDADCQFAHGSFIPDDFRWNPGDGEEVNRTVIDLPSGYDELDMELRDFDLVYAYPWPDEHALFHSIVRQFGNSSSLFLSYDAREGIDLVAYRDLM